MASANDDTITLAPSLDTLINEFENCGIITTTGHKDAGKCDFRLGKGNPLSPNQCIMCARLSSLMDLMNSWKQPIDTGRLTGRSIEIIPITTSSKLKLKDVENAWILYRECDNCQRNSSQFLIRRYHASFTCDGLHYNLREVTTSSSSSPPPPLNVMCMQLIELFSNEDALPKHFVHGNPTVSSISFGKTSLPIPVKHRVRDITYFSKYLLQIDCSAHESIILSSVKKKEPIGAIIYDSSRKLFLIRREATYDSFLNDYPRYSRVLSFFLLLRGLLSFYSTSSQIKDLNITPSKSQTLKQAFDEIKGNTIDSECISTLFSCVSRTVMT